MLKMMAFVMLVSIVSLFIVWLYTTIENIKLSVVLKKVDGIKWEKLHTYHVFGKTLYPFYGYKTISYIFNNDECNYVDIRKMKKRIRVGVGISTGVFFILVISVLIMQMIA